MDVEPTAQQTPRGLEAEQSSTNNDSALGGLGARQDGVAIIERMKDEYAVCERSGGCSQAVYRRNHPAAAGGDHQRVVGSTTPPLLTTCC